VDFTIKGGNRVPPLNVVVDTLFYSVGAEPLAVGGQRGLGTEPAPPTEIFAAFSEKKHP